MSDLHRARGLWTLYESVHAVTYFAPDALGALAEAGLRGFWRGYFAARAAPLGPVGPAPVVALFAGFAPDTVARALPAVWQIASSATVLSARSSGAAAAIRSVAAAPDDALLRRLESVAAALPVTGRALGAANQALPVLDEPYQRLWQACTTLREWRGDAHVAALVAHGLSGLDALLLRADLDRLQEVRGWSDEQWQAAGSDLAARGLLRAGSGVTDAGRALIASVERATDAASCVEDRALARQLAPFARACRALLPAANPIGLVAPWDPDSDPDAELVATP